MVKFFMGIDPGKTGGVSMVDIDMNIINSYSMPLIGTGKDSELDVWTIYRFIKRFEHSEIIIGIEKSQAMPGQGITGMFNYGKGYGELIGMLKVTKRNYKEIRPIKWKNAMNLTLKGLTSKEKSDKNALTKKRKTISIDLCEALFPNIIVRGPKGGFIDGKAESLLIAEYMRRIHGKS